MSATEQTPDIPFEGTPADQVPDQPTGAKTYPGSVEEWRSVRAFAHTAMAQASPDARAICATIEAGFQAVTFVLTQIRFDAKGGRQ